jgi:hypothetical protein
MSRPWPVFIAHAPVSHRSDRRTNARDALAPSARAIERPLDPITPNGFDVRHHLPLSSCHDWRQCVDGTLALVAGSTTATLMPGSRLDRMRGNPAGDWTINDVAAPCREHAIRCTPPSGGGSHWKMSDPTQRDIPQRRPVVRRLVRFVDQVKATRHGQA